MSRRGVRLSERDWWLSRERWAAKQRGVGAYISRERSGAKHREMGTYRQRKMGG